MQSGRTGRRAWPATPFPSARPLYFTAFTTYGGWGSEFRNKYVEPFYTSPSSKKPKPRAATVG
eukprot:scaffold18891_cov135-Isochrysis_galbana.AAC.4